VVEDSVVVAVAVVLILIGLAVAPFVVAVVVPVVASEPFVVHAIEEVVLLLKLPFSSMVEKVSLSPCLQGWTRRMIHEMTFLSFRVVGKFVSNTDDRERVQKCRGVEIG